MPKVAMMGAGSAGFCRTLVQDILSYETMQDIHFSLMDVDPERLKTVHQVLSQLKKQHNLSCTFTATTDRAEAVADADFAISMIQVGGLEPYAFDIDIPLKYGVDQCVGDTVGPGGIFRGLRHVPALLDMLEEMTQHAKPEFIFMNYANPMAICSWAMQQEYPEISCVGLCHGVQHTTNQLCRWLDIPSTDVDVLTAGINHMAWFLEFSRDGEDLYPLMWEKLDKEGPIEGEDYRFEMMKAAGYFMTESPGHLSEYLPYFRKRQDIMDLFNGPGFSGETRYYLDSCSRGVARYKEQMNKWANGEEPVPFDKGHRSVEYASSIMNAKLGGDKTRLAGNILNKDFITNLPYDSCVEVPVFADRTGLHGAYVGDIPAQCAALCQSNISAQELAVDAALNGDHESVFHALLLDPLTAAVLAPHEIRNMADEMIEAQMQWLPQFQDNPPIAPAHTIGCLPNGANSLKSDAQVASKIDHYD